MARPPIAYYRNFDSEALYACVGPFALQGLFRFGRSSKGEAEWVFLVPGSPEWDSVHQSIYLNPRVESVQPAELPAGTPPVPEAPPGPYPKPESHYLPARPVRATEYPAVAALVESQAGQPLRVHVTLSEDLYETRFGDGEFHYLDDVFLSREEATLSADSQDQELSRVHLREISIAIRDGCFDFPLFDHRLFDRYRAEQVLERLEAKLRGRARD